MITRVIVSAESTFRPWYVGQSPVVNHVTLSGAIHVAVAYPDRWDCWRVHIDWLITGGGGFRPGPSCGSPGPGCRRDAAPCRAIQIQAGGDAGADRRDRGRVSGAPEEDRWHHSIRMGHEQQPGRL